MKKQNARSLTGLIDAAFQSVAEKVIEDAMRTGTPVILWEKGQVKKVPPDELEPLIKRRSRKKTKSRKRGKK
ncbi:MAG TPA: hypothetical protein VFA18_18895 [Gemmataceae bacterium]|nr:hypothetical protein [Gemmataceae bacterium]